MSQIKTLNGVQYTLPQFNDTGWGANTGNVLTQYIAAIADVTLQLSGGAFTLTAETDFGGNFGLKALYLKSETTNPASAGVVRLAKTDSIKWRNNANSADVALAIDGSDNLTFSGTKVPLSGLIVNADIAAGAAIAYSKLALTGSIVNADIASAAAIAVNKLAALAATLVVVSDASGFLSTTGVTTTPTELNFVHGVTSAIQTQLSSISTVANAALPKSGGTMTGTIAMGTAKVTGLGAPTVSGDALSQGAAISVTTGAFSGQITQTDTSDSTLINQTVGSSVNGTLYRLISGTNSGSANAGQLGIAKATGVNSSTFTNIVVGSSSGLYQVEGYDGSTIFSDIVNVTFLTFSVINSLNQSSFAARTYQMTTGTLQLKIASGTASCYTTALVTSQG